MLKNISFTVFCLKSLHRKEESRCCVFCTFNQLLLNHSHTETVNTALLNQCLLGGRVTFLIMDDFTVGDSTFSRFPLLHPGWSPPVGQKERARATE